MSFTIIRNDITKVKADAIVNSANPDPVVGRGLDYAVYKAAGYEKLLKARRGIGAINRGDAVPTPAFGLNAKYIIHTVGPVWVDGAHGEFETLGSCYKRSLAAAEELGCQSIAFPLIATGVYGFPKDKALDIALAEIQSFLEASDMQITLVVYSREAFVVSEKLIGGIEQFIKDSETENPGGEFSEYAGNFPGRDRSKAVKTDTRSGRSKGPALGGSSGESKKSDKREILFNAALPFKSAKRSDDTAFADAAASLKLDETYDSDVNYKSASFAAEQTLDEFIGTPSETFQTMLFRLIDKSGLTDVTVYKKANIDRKVFSKIRSRSDYKPSKETAVAFAIALELDIDTANELLARAGLALSPSNKFDLVVKYFILNRIYDIGKLNSALFSYGLECIGVAE